jgi:protein tyrosine phosphatase (PTP) superfamily phosphohydrolase (DUF442 family)
VKKILKSILVGFISLIVLVLWWLGYLRYSGNFHKIDNQVYRSGQLYSFNFEKFYKKYHFKTILNLRGAKPDKKWYQYEKEFAKKHNITLIDFKLNDRKIQTIQTMKKLVNIINKAKKPLLIHCKAGADRTGLASALYLYSKHNPKAKEMLSVKYGHFPYLGSPTKAMDKSFNIYIK